MSATNPQIPLREEAVREAATPESFARGEAYLQAGALRQPVLRDRQLSALCQGNGPRPYRVSITLAPHRIADASCSCPYDWGGICKHQVALLLLYVRHPEGIRRESEEKDADRLRALSQEDLIALVLKMVDREPRLRRLLPQPEGRRGARISFEGDLEEFAAPVREALEGAPDYDYDSDESDWDEVRDFLRDSRDLAGQDPVRAVASVTAFLEVLDESVQEGEKDAERLCELIGEAEKDLESLVSGLSWPDPQRRDWILRCLRNASRGITEVDWAGLAVAGATDQEYPLVESEVRARLAELPSARRGAFTGSYGAGRWLSVLLSLLEGQGREKELEEVCWEYGIPSRFVGYLLTRERFAEGVAYAREHVESSADLSRIVKVLMDSERWTEAMDLAEHTLTRTDLEPRERRGVLGFISQAAEQTGNLETAREATRKALLLFPSLEDFHRFAGLSERLGDGEEQVEQVAAALESRPPTVGLQSLIADIRLSQGDVARALEIARNLELHQAETIERVADAASDHPQDAIALYQRLAESAIGETNRESYRYAARCLGKAREVARRSGLASPFEAYLQDLRARHKRKRALMEELARL